MGSNRTACARRGFTLIELAVGMVLSSIILLALASAVVIASHALPDGQNPAYRLLDGQEILDRFTGELLCATQVTEKTATSVTLTVADRNHGAAGPETIRYAWSGTPGEPLTRRYNDGSALTVVDDVYEFALTYGSKVVVDQPAPYDEESNEVLLYSYEDLAGLADYSLTSSAWLGQYFHPTMPADAVAWKVTRVKFMARANGQTKGITAVQLRLPANGDMPGPTVVQAVPMYESALGSAYSWQEFSFSSVSGLSPSQGLCLVLALQKNDSVLADIQYDADGGAGRLTSADGGSSWSFSGSTGMLCYVYGTTTVSILPDPIVDEWLRSVGIKLRAGADSSTRVETSVQLLNAPQVAAP